MNRLFLGILACAAVYSCSKSAEVNPDPAGASGSQALELQSGNIPIEFYIADAPDATEETRAAAVTSLSSFYVNITSGVSDTPVFSNVKFSLSDGKYISDRVLCWPATDAGYHFYASNVEMDSGGEPLVYCSPDIDVVCARSLNSTYGEAVGLSFNHVYARINRVNAMCSNYGQNLVLSVSAPDSGIYNIKTGEWSSTAARRQFTIYDDGDALDGAQSYKYCSNDIWVVPGTYEVTATLDAWNGLNRGIPTATSSCANLTLAAGKIQDLRVKVWTYTTLAAYPKAIAVNVGSSFDISSVLTFYYGSFLVGVPINVSRIGYYKITFGYDRNYLSEIGGTYRALKVGTTYLYATYEGCTCRILVTITDPAVVVDEPEEPDGVEYRNVCAYISADPSTLPSEGGASTLSWSACYEWRHTYASGRQDDWTAQTAVPTITGGASGFSRDGSVVTASANDDMQSRSVTYYASFSISGESDIDAVTITQVGCSGPVITSTTEEVEQGYEERVVEADGGETVCSDYKASVSLNPAFGSSAAGVVTVTASASHTESVYGCRQVQRRSTTRTYTVYHWSDGSTTYGAPTDWTPSGDWTDYGERILDSTPSAVTQVSDLFTLSSDSSWFGADGSYEANTSGVDRTAVLTCTNNSSPSSSATASFTQIGSSYYIEVEIE